MPNTTWSTTDKTANITLSGADLIATCGAAADNACRVAHGQQSGKYYVEGVFTVFAGSQSSFGAARGDAVLTGTNSIGSTSNKALLVYKNGQIWKNGANTGLTLGAIAAGTIIGMALDLDNDRAWLRQGAAGNWNGSGLATPATPSTGTDISGTRQGPAFAFFAAMSANANLDSCTINVGDSAFTGAVPAGFTSGWPTSSLPTNQVVTQAAVEAWVVNESIMQLTQLGLEVWVSSVNRRGVLIPGL
jgi:hypothetical protein